MRAKGNVITVHRTITDPAQRAQRLGVAYGAIAGNGDVANRLGNSVALLVGWGREARARQDAQKGQKP